MKNYEKAQYILHKIGPSEVLAQLAEEASELAQAALKVRRACGKVNPTPLTALDCDARLMEEIFDVDTVMYVYSDPGADSAYNLNPFQVKKLDRWVERLEEAEEAEEAEDNDET